MLLRLCAVLLLSALITTETQARSAEENRLLTAAFNVPDAKSKLKALEPDALQAAGKQVERNDDRVIVHLTGGGSRVFTNAPSCKLNEFGSGCETYSLITDVKSAGIIVLVHAFYEETAYDLVDDRTGRSIEVDYMPLLSPSSQRLLVFRNSPWQDLTGIEIWRHARGNFVKEWEGDPRKDKTGVDAFRLNNWVSEQRIMLQYSSPLGQDPSQNPVHHFAMALSGGKWAVSESSD